MPIKVNPADGALLEIGERRILIASTEATLVSPPEKPARNLDWTPDNIEVLSRSSNIQTLRCQAVDVVASRQMIAEAALHDIQQDASNRGFEGHLLDVTTMSRKSKKGDEEGDTDLLILHVCGNLQNELVAVVSSAPKYTRHRSEAAFADYNYFFSSNASSQTITPGVLREHTRQRDEEEAEAGTREDVNESTSDDLLSERFIVHTFPSKICSIQFGPTIPSFGRVHSGPWVCIRTTSSTLFASIEVSSKKELLLGHTKLRLVSLLEIIHGNSVLSSGVISRRVRGNRQLSEREKKLRSRFPIIDVRFHVDRCTSATTVDSMGNVGVFECDLHTVRETSWENGVSWSVKQKAQVKEAEESHWMIEWAEEEGVVILANRSLLQALSLLDGTRKTIYSCNDASISAIARSNAPSSLLWVATTKHILLFELHSETSFQGMLSWEHHRSHGNQLCLSPITSSNEGNAVLLSNRCDRMLSLFTATESLSMVQATTIGEASHVDSALLSGNSYACGPAFVKLTSLHFLWHKWLRRMSRGKRTQVKRDHLMIEIGRDYSVRIKAVSWSPSASLPARRLGDSRTSKVKEIEAGKISTILPEIIAGRTLHSLGPLYRVLIGRSAAEERIRMEALTVLIQASRWLQEQDVPLETMLLPHDLLALSNEEEMERPKSILMQYPLLPMAIATTPETQRLLQQLFSSAQSDAWTMDLSQLIEGQICAQVPSLEGNLDDLSERMMGMYLSQDDTSRPYIAMERLVNKMRTCCREIEWDLLFSSRVISMRPIVVREASPEEGEEVENQAAMPSGVSHKIPPFTFSFFTPRLALPSSSEPPPTYNATKPKKRVMTKSARWLLSEWQVGTNPKEYIFKHPYTNPEEADSNLDEYNSQSESEQRSSRRRSTSSRAVSVNLDPPLEIASQQAPPTIGSASQPMFATSSSYATRPPPAQSQPVFSSAHSINRAKPKKRRVGGF